MSRVPGNGSWRGILELNNFQNETWQVVWVLTSSSGNKKFWSLVTFSSNDSINYFQTFSSRIPNTILNDSTFIRILLENSQSSFIYLNLSVCLLLIINLQYLINFGSQNEALSFYFNVICEFKYAMPFFLPGLMSLIYLSKLKIWKFWFP